jgi:hypothetical protein
MFSYKIFIGFILAIFLTNNAIADFNNVQTEIDLLTYELWCRAWWLFLIGLVVDRFSFKIFNSSLRIFTAAVIFVIAMLVIRYAVLRV